MGWATDYIHGRLPWALVLATFWVAASAIGAAYFGPLGWELIDWKGKPKRGFLYLLVSFGIVLAGIVGGLWFCAVQIAGWP